MHEFETRFGGLARLYDAAALARLHAAHVCIVGLGGVGSWTVEALARSGVGELTLVDLDDVCVTNINRQLPALTSTLGLPKAEVLAARVADINPGARVQACLDFFTAANAPSLLATKFNCVVDAIDSPSLKALLVAACRERHLPIVTSGGAGGRRDPTRVHVADLAHTSRDPLLANVRSLLRKQHGFPRGDRPFGVACVFSTEPMLDSQAPPAACASESGVPGSLCDHAFGSACFVTGSFGFAAAAQVVAQITCTPGPLAPPAGGRRAA
jgi:tRNA A37 threonylcarbamoyladenosine dehydratase